MAGSGASQGFDAAAFRTAIRNTMVMGQPQATNQQVTFLFDEKATYAVKDPAGVPYDFGETPTVDVAGRQVIVPCAVHFGWEVPKDTTVGQFDINRVTITLLDTDYALVKDADEVVINSVHYVIDTVAPPVGLFDVTVYQLFCRSRG